MINNNNKGEVTDPHKCEYCEQEMYTFDWKESQGCVVKTISIEGELRPRVPYIAPYLGDNYKQCHDCGATEGRYHHPGCDMERCINCDGQLISCNCENVNINGKPIQLPADLLIGVALRDSPCTICGTKPSTEYYPLVDELGNHDMTFWTCKKHSHNPKIEKDLKKGVSIKTIIKKWNK